MSLLYKYYKSGKILEEYLPENIIQIIYEYICNYEESELNWYKICHDSYLKDIERFSFYHDL